MTTETMTPDAAPETLRTGSTRAAVPAALRSRRRTRTVAPLAMLAISALALGGVALPGVLGNGISGSNAPSVAEISDQQAQAYQASLADVASPQEPASAPIVRDGATVAVETPTPTPTPTPSPSSSASSEPTTDSGSSSDSGAGSGSGSGNSGSGSEGGYIAPAGEAQQIAHDLVIGRGWSEGEFACLVNLWDRESGWRVTAENPSSGAYGIPQALPGSKMSSVGGDWSYNATTQIVWGLGYISDRYGTPCGAWGHSESVGWY